MTAVDRLAEELRRQLESRWVIDAHEHLADEAERLTATVDAVSAFGWYPKWPAQAAGMSPAEYAVWQDLTLPLERRWAVLSKYLPLIRTTTFVRSVLVGIRELYGYDELTDGNYQEVSRAMREANRPGIYRRVFRDHARIAAALNQGFADRLPEPGCFRIPQMWFDELSAAAGPGGLARLETVLGRRIPSLRAWTDAVPEVLERYRRQGVVGIKMGHLPIPRSDPLPLEVAPLFERLLGRAEGTGDAGAVLAANERAALSDFEAHVVLRAAGPAGLPVIYHTGYEGVWVDFRASDPRELVPVFLRYRDVSFELYHAGTVWDRELGMIALAFPNVWLDQCWAHALSREMARSALDGWLDMVPANKIIAWGGDAHTQIEAVLGDLVQVRESIAAVMARRIREGSLTESRALELAGMMLHDNPKNLYRLAWDEPGALVYA